MKTQIIDVPPRELTPGGPVKSCVNLVATSLESVPALVPAPALSLYLDGGYRPLAVYVDESMRRHTLLTRESAPGSWQLAVECAGNLSIVGSCASPSVAVAHTGGFIVMTADGPLYADLDAAGLWSLADRRAAAIPPGISLRAVGCGTLSADTAALTVKDVDLSRTSPGIGSQGCRAISRMLADAYGALSALAADAGLWIQPVIARCHLTGAGGERLCSSAPVVLSAPGGWQCVSQLSVACVKNGDALDLPHMRLEAGTYKIALDIDTESASRLVASGVRAIEVCVTPQFHPLDASAPLPVRLQRVSTSAPLLTVALPGATDGFNSRNRLRAEQLRRVMAALASAERTERCVEYPFAAGSTVFGRSMPLDADTEAGRLQSVMALPLSYRALSFADSLKQAIMPPCSFTAGAVAVSGDTVVWADITPLPAPVTMGGNMFGSRGDASFQGVAVVTMRSGSRRFLTFSGSECPQSWAPGVFYPDAQAVAVEVYVTDTQSGTTLRGSLSLEALPDGSGAVNISPDLSCVAFEQWSGPIPDGLDDDSGAAADARRPGAVVACRLAEPLLPLAITECSPSPVVTLTPALRSQSSWDFSRCHLYAFSAAGIYAVSVNAARSAVSASLIDPRGVVRPDAVCRTPQGVMALSGGTLIRVTASKSDDMASPRPFSALAWHHAMRRLVLADSSGNLWLHYPDSGGWSALTAPVDFEELAADAGDMWLCDADSLFRFSDSSGGGSSAMRSISWSSSVSVPRGMRVAAVEIIMSVSSATGRLELTAQSSPADGTARRLLAMDFEGAIRSPVVRRIVAPPRPLVHLRLDAEVSSDFILRSVRVHFVSL